MWRGGALRRPFTLARLISDFRAEALRASGPREALERLNDRLLARSTRGMFVTMTYLVLDAASGEVSYSSAGHLPILRLHGATREVEPLDGGMGLPLGIVKHPGLGEQRLVFAPGDALVLVTDGVIEAMNGKYSASSLGGSWECSAGWGSRRTMSWMRCLKRSAGFHRSRSRKMI